MADDILIANVGMSSGSVVYWQVPQNTCSIAFHAKGGDVLFTGERNDVGAPTWTVKEGDKEVLNGRAFQGKTLCFSGVTGVVLEIRYILGFMQ